MDLSHDPIDKILEALRERAKELNCLYQVDEKLNQHDATPDEIFRGLIELIPAGYQYPAVCHSSDAVSVPIPADLPKERIVFSANRYVSNGKVPDITHVVYVDPAGYRVIEDPNDLREVGRAVGKLNKLLPKRQFILLGPGRWGSRGDIKLGVSVTYSDINNTAVLVEIARKEGNYVPDLSFGTHFFQDLVEASIRYLPLYPDEPDIIFNEEFLTGSSNILPDLLPEYARRRVVNFPLRAGARGARHEIDPRRAASAVATAAYCRRA